MTISKQKKILQRIKVLEHDIETLRDVRIRIASEEYVSAALASQGGSKSYTRSDYSKIGEVLKQLIAELKGLRALLAGTSPALPQKILTVYT